MLQQAAIEIIRRGHSIVACLRARCAWVFFFTHMPFVVNPTFNTTPSESCNSISPFFPRDRTCRMFCKGCTWHDLHILVTATFRCDLQSRAASAQSITLWQQATIKITRRDHYYSIIASSGHTDI